MWQGDGEGDQCGQARPGPRARTGSSARAGAAGAAAAGTVARSARAAVLAGVPPIRRQARGRLIRRRVRSRPGCHRVRAARAVSGLPVGRGIRRQVAAVALLQQVQVGLDAQLLQGAGHPGGTQVQGPLLHMLPGRENLIAGELAGDHPGVAGGLPERAHVRLAAGSLLPLAGGFGIQE
jgi:hypothetical protein